MVIALFTTVALGVAFLEYILADSIQYGGADGDWS